MPRSAGWARDLTGAEAIAVAASTKGTDPATAFRPAGSTATVVVRFCAVPPTRRDFETKVFPREEFRRLGNLNRQKRSIVSAEVRRDRWPEHCSCQEPWRRIRY